ncbi:MAG: ferredoxin [Desulfuromonadales bacterium GWD2_54_10]|nr:MAG: ferredoxin [Desulfuromonadales bacterium GWD2_54_10]
MKGFSYLPDVVTLTLDVDACIGCELCCKVCPHCVFSMHNNKAVIADRDSCMECGACALNCPTRAIMVDAGVGCASGMINQWLASLNIRFKDNDTCC